MIKRSECELIILDYLREPCFDDLPVRGSGVGVRYVGEHHPSPGSMWRRVDGLWARFQAQPDVPDVGFCFLLKNYANQTLMTGLSRLGCPLVLHFDTPHDQWFRRPVADDGSRVLFWVPEDVELSQQDLHSRANVEKLVEFWLEYDHIPSYIPEDYRFPWELGPDRPRTDG